MAKNKKPTPQIEVLLGSVSGRIEADKLVEKKKSRGYEPVKHVQGFHIRTKTYNGIKVAFLPANGSSDLRDIFDGLVGMLQPAYQEYLTVRYTKGNGRTVNQVVKSCDDFESIVNKIEAAKHVLLGYFIRSPEFDVATTVHRPVEDIVIAAETQQEAQEARGNSKPVSVFDIAWDGIGGMNG